MSINRNFQDKEITAAFQKKNTRKSKNKNRKTSPDAPSSSNSPHGNESESNSQENADVLTQIQTGSKRASPANTSTFQNQEKESDSQGKENLLPQRKTSKKKQSKNANLRRTSKDSSASPKDNEETGSCSQEIETILTFQNSKPKRKSGHTFGVVSPNLSVSSNDSGNGQNLRSQESEIVSDLSQSSNPKRKRSFNGTRASSNEDGAAESPKKRKASDSKSRETDQLKLEPIPSPDRLVVDENPLEEIEENVSEFVIPKQKRKKVADKWFKQSSSAKKAGIFFDPRKTQKNLQKHIIGKKVSKGAGVYLASTMEYLVTEIVEMSKEESLIDKKGRITPRHIQMAIWKDSDFNELLSKVTIPEAGVLPRIHKQLLSKNSQHL